MKTIWSKELKAGETLHFSDKEVFISTIDNYRITVLKRLYFAQLFHHGYRFRLGAIFNGKMYIEGPLSVSFVYYEALSFTYLKVVIK